MAIHLAASLSHSRKKNILTLRSLLIVCAWALFSLRPETSMKLYGHALFALFTASNLLLMLLREVWFSHTRFIFSVVVADTVLASVLLYGSGAADYGLFVVFFLMILLAAAGQRFNLILTAGVLAGIGYLLLGLRSGSLETLLHRSDLLLKVPLLFVVSLFYGYFLDENQSLRDALRRSSRQVEHFGSQMQRTYWETLQSLINALDLRDTSTRHHSVRVTAYTLALCRALGVPERDWPHIERGALLHDIGKIGISDTVLLKRGALSEDEWKVIKLHPLFGYQMVHGIPFLERASQIILHHHERWDGKGYPFGLRTDAIPLPARVFAVADAMDAITSGRPYKEKQDWDEVSKALLSGSGKQFDPRVVQAYLHVPLRRWQSIQEEVERESRALAPPSLAEIESHFVAGAPARSAAPSESAVLSRVIDRLAADIEPADRLAGRAERVLLVDDEATVSAFLKKLLEQAGYEVDTALDAEEALRRLKSSTYQLAVIDYVLPGQNGQTLYERLRALDPALARRVLVISGAPLESGLLRFLARDHVRFLRKPFHPQELISAVRDIDSR